jgi:hypothetical protein
MQNQQTMFSLENTQVSALQQADQIRKEMEIDKLSAIENALNAYDQHIADMREYDVTQESLKSDAKDRNEEAVGLWGMNDERVDVEDKLDGDDVDYREVELSFEDDE